jgi:hypothetical protein
MWAIGMSKSGRQLLIDSLKRRVLPTILDSGWISHQRASEFDSSELRRAAPLGYFRRNLPDGVQAVDFFFDKGRPQFQISFGTLPSIGMRSLIDKNVMVPPESLGAQLANDSHILKPNGLFRTFFGFGFWETPSPQSADRISQSVCELWPQVEAYFMSGVIGRNFIDGSGLKIHKHKSGRL